MVGEGPERPRQVEPLDWRDAKFFSSRAIVAALEEKGYAATLDMLAAQGAKRGLDFEREARAALDDIQAKLTRGEYSEQQAQFMRNESDALSRMMRWGKDQGLIDDNTYKELSRAVNLPTLTGKEEPDEKID
jgi:hypothetical protein